ncbi:nitrile hydratase subunit beta [Pseudomonas coleopterorum]|uniref:Nitrile hydratase subunit beta n=1 Tax=Pseudomonas coleopterorum TaxID=1605838 RepID=A0AAJ6M2B1_9PSED|nr:SH3-like domain-containing protein [Pseudomonas coleopterorum]WNC11010.1 nitrile hydratase subunit beta [Pseudomonas coleopterorum]
MNGIHDLGGLHGFGPVLAEEDEPVFHHDWERRIFPLFAALFAGGHFNVDEFRLPSSAWTRSTTWRAATTSTGYTPSRHCCWKKV